MHIHQLLKDRIAAGTPTFLLQIGAMDGVSAQDPVYEALRGADWAALLVEPVPEYFEMLRQNYAGQERITLANVAIADHSGETLMHRICPQALKAGDVPHWGHGATSLHTDRTALHWDHIKPHVREITVPCLTLPDLLNRYNVASIDILQIDAEGHDYAILRQLDFSRYRPAIINLEIVNLPEEEQEACKALLAAQSYKYAKTGYDLVAVPVS